jgi:hypothetical protein
MLTEIMNRFIRELNDDDLADLLTRVAAEQRRRQRGRLASRPSLVDERRQMRGYAPHGDRR